MELLMDIVSYCFDAIMLFIFNRTFFLRVKQEISLRELIAIYAVVECASAFINHIRSNIWLNILVSVIGLFVITCFYESVFWYRMTGVVLFQMLAIVAEMLSSELLFRMPQGDAVMPEGLLVSKLLLFLLVVFTHFFQKDKGVIPAKYLLCFLLIPFFSIVILYSVTGNLGRGRLTMYMLVFCILMINLISYYLLNLLAGYIIQEGKNLQTQEQIRIQKEKYSQLTAAFSKGLQILHDVNKHFRYIYQDLENGNTREAMNYIEKMDDSLKNNYSTIQTGNLVIDSILSNMYTRLTDAGCACDIVINMDVHRIQIEDYDLVILLGNITDNQIEAVLQVEQEEKKKVFLELTMGKGNFLIHAKNGMSEKRRERRKAEYWFHGFGMKNVSDVAQRYGGTVSTEAKGGWFETMVVIPMGGRKDEY